MALLFCRTRHRSVANPSIIRLFSTSSSPPEDPTSGDGNRNTESNNSSPRTSYFSDIRASLKKQHPQRTAATNFDEVRKNLSEFRRSSTADSQPQRQMLLQELFNKEGLRRPHDQNTTAPGTAGARDPFDAIKESLKQLSSIKDRLKVRPEESNAGPRVIGGTQEWLPMVSLNDKVKESGEESDSKAKFLKIYSVTELGEKLRKLRPEGLGKEGGFSFTELNERLVKLREMEEKFAKEAESNSSLLTFSELRKSLNALQTSDEDKKKAANRHRYPFMSPLDKTADFINHPPKEHLVEKYFHPDNMSSAEKMKVELANVREEFKMSESDCGSARVQVAQLTTKIKHLSDVLHKKDKHSRKGLQAMVERRKKLLKYLRRTDWDSYCIVLSKLGLRDNPDYKQSSAINKKKLLSR